MLWEMVTIGISDIWDLIYSKKNIQVGLFGNGVIMVFW